MNTDTRGKAAFALRQQDGLILLSSFMFSLIRFRLLTVDVSEFLHNFTRFFRKNDVNIS